jgi:integrase/recombinase XerD
VLSSAQVKHALRVSRARTRHGSRAEAALAVSLALGLRAKELAALKWSDVYDDKGRVRAVVHLKTAYTKGGKTRDVFVSSPTLRRVLEKYGDRDSLLRLIASGAALFASQKGGAMTPSSMARFLKNLYCEAGVPGASSHSGRRTLITRLAERGVDLKAIAQIAGHTSIRTTALYVESNPRRLARILQDVSW